MPRIGHRPESVSSAGAEAVELAASAGLILDPWQAKVLEWSLGEGRDGKFTSFEVGLVVARQNGKGSILEARELAGLFLLGEQLIIHSAHEFKTAQEGFRRILRLVEETPDLDRRVKRVRQAHGDEGIELKSGQRLRFVARTGGSGRGFSGDCVILDEAFNLPEQALGALMPTLSARPNPQIWYASSAVDQNVHPNGVVLARVRERGMAAVDPSLTYMEWSADPTLSDAGDSEVQWAQANPGLGIRIDLDHVAREHRSMSPQTFAVERLSIGDWPSTTGGGQVIDAETWRGLLDVTSRPDGRPCFAVDVTPDRGWSTIGMAGWAENDRRHVEITDHKEGTRWVVRRLLELTDRWGPCAVLVDAKGPAGSLVSELVDAGLTEPSGDPSGRDCLVTASASDMAQACGLFYDAAHADQIRHIGQQPLDQALKVATKRPLSDAWAWSRKSDGVISPLVAATLAAWGLQTYGRTVELEPFAAWA